jgi:cytoskeletal protein RodZ
MPMNDGFDPDHPLPSFLSGHADKHEQRETFEYELLRTSRILKASILAIAVMAGGIAIAISLGIPAKVFADATALLPDTSAPQPSANQAAPPIQSDAQAIQPTADAQAIETTADAKASAPTTSEPPTRDEIVAAAQPASQTQTENRGPDTEALFTEYQAWAAKENRQAQNAAQPSQVAPAQVVDDAPAPVRPAHKHQRVRSVENANAPSSSTRSRPASLR